MKYMASGAIEKSRVTASIRINAPSECLKSRPPPVHLPESSETGAALSTAADDDEDRGSRSRPEKAARAGATTATASAVSRRHNSGSLHLEDAADEDAEGAAPFSIVTEAGEFLKELEGVLLSITTVECGSESAALELGARATSSIQSSRPTTLLPFFRPIINFCISPCSSPAMGGFISVKISAVSLPLFCTS